MNFMYNKEEVNPMDQYQKFYKRTKEERIAILTADDRYQSALDRPLDAHVAEAMIENQVSTVEIPLGVAVNFVIDNEPVVIPMAIEEPSVIAAASKAAGMFRTNGGFTTITCQREMMGQILFAPQQDQSKLFACLSQTEVFTHIAHEAFPSIVKRGGGIRDYRIRVLEDGYVSFDVFFDTQEAMGANMMNTMLEAIQTSIEAEGFSSLMAILSNLPERCLVEVVASVSFDQLTGGEACAQRIVSAYEIAKRDPYRAATNNKGVMNGLDAFCVATGNDWRAIAAGLYSYNALDSSMQPFVTWELDGDHLVGRFKGPLPLASVGGSMQAHPKYQLAQTILRQPDAKGLMSIGASLAIAQNFAALYALVSDGIQKGHMNLHLRTMAIVAGASEEEMVVLLQEISKLKPLNQQRVNEILQNIRNIK